MAIRALPVTVTTLLFTLSAVTASPQGPPGGFGGSNPYSGSSGSGSESGPGRDGSGSDFGSIPGLQNIKHHVVIHAVLAALAWVLLLPIGAILLRLNIQSPIILKLHAACQIIAYFVYVVAAGLGIWIIRQVPSSRVNLFSDPHPIIGLAILAVALFQPLWGIIHHNKFKRGLAAWKAGQSTQKPGRTGFGRLHLWIGRVLITLAMLNGGLGFRLASKSPFPPAKSAKIAYAVVALVMWLLYVIIVSVFEARKAASRRGSGTREEQYALKRGEPPAYDESRESL